VIEEQVAVTAPNLHAIGYCIGPNKNQSATGTAVSQANAAAVLGQHDNLCDLPFVVLFPQAASNPGNNHPLARSLGARQTPMKP
jgi:hypothetical protein